MRKYVISEDIYILLQKWVGERNFSLPTNKFFRRLRIEMQDFLEGIFGKNRVDMVSERELTRGVKDLVSRSGLYPISIDRVYFPTQPSLEINRIINQDLVKQGVGARFGFMFVQEQIKKISRYCPREIVLIDDVIFSGTTLSNAVDIFTRHNIEVKLIITGIVVGNGFKALRQKGLKVEFVRFYSEVIDEICERDFYPGVPFSGRFITGPKVETGASYLSPFGKPQEWASVPKEKEKEFSIFCLNQSIKLWKAIEKASDRIVRCCDLNRIPIGISYSKNRFISELERILELILTQKWQS